MIAVLTLLIGHLPLNNSPNALKDNGRIASLLAGEISVAVVAKIKFQQLFSGCSAMLNDSLSQCVIGKPF